MYQGIYLKKILNKIANLMVIISLVSSQFVYANPNDGSKSDLPSSNERIDFQKALSPEDIQSVGVDPNKIITMNTDTTLPDGEKAQVDLLEVVTSSQAALKVFKLLEKQIRMVHTVNPDAKFKFLYLPDGSSPDADNNNLTAQQMVSILDSIDGKTTEVHTAKVDSGTIAKLRQTISSIYDETTTRDVKLGLIRFAVNGTVTFAIYHMTYPAPISAIMGFLTGFMSMNFGVLLKKYVRWLTDNEAKPDQTRLQRFRGMLFSTETLLIMTPFLIGLQDHNLVNAAGISSAVGATVMIQNIYRYLKSKSPQKAFYYKWYSTELMFMTIPFLVLPFAGIYAHSPIFSLVAMSVILKTYLLGLLTTSSQGYSDDVTTALQDDPLKEAEKKDAETFLKKFGETNIYNLSQQDHDGLLSNAIMSAVKDKYTKYYLGSSILAVASMTIMQLGNFNHNTTEIVAGFVGLLSLTATSKIVWTIHKIQNKRRARAQDVIDFTYRPSTEEVLTCSSLFAI